MNVFVLTAGRTGSVSFAAACQRITNYSSGHETRSRNWRDRWGYPPNHIEVDPRLAWWLGTLGREFPDARYVWLRRRREAVVRSTAKRQGPRNAASHWPFVAFLAPKDLGPLDAAGLMVAQIEDNIAEYLDGRPFHEVWIEDPATSFTEWWRDIGAEGDLVAALGDLAVVRNQSG